MKFLHEMSDVQSKNIGEDTKVWQFVVIFEKAVVGKNCNICANTLIENDVIIGDSVTIKSGVYVWDGVRIEDNVFIGPCVAFTNDKYPRSKINRERSALTIVCEGASIGANATILPGITIGQKALVGAGSVVTRDVPANVVVVGNPAKIVERKDTATV